MRDQGDAQSGGDGKAAEKRAVATLAALLPATAEANSGIGLFIFAIPAMILALPVAILVEAPVLSRGLAIPFGRALRTSALMNVVSTVIGFGAALALDLLLLMPIGSSGASGGRAVMLVALVPMFFITWWIEAWIVRSNHKEAARRKVVLSTLAANALTYALMAAGTFIWASPYGGSPRMYITEIINDIGVTKVDTAEEFQKNGRFGPAKSVQPRNRLLKSLRVEADGRVVGVLTGDLGPEFDGKAIMLQPRVENGTIVEWRCTSGIQSKYLPAQCR